MDITEYNNPRMSHRCDITGTRKGAILTGSVLRVKSNVVPL